MAKNEKYAGEGRKERRNWEKEAHARCEKIMITREILRKI